MHPLLFAFLLLPAQPQQKSIPQAPPAQQPSAQSALDSLLAQGNAGDPWAMWIIYRVYSDDIFDVTPPDFELPADKRSLWDLGVAAAKQRDHKLSPPDMLHWLQKGHDAGNNLCTDELAAAYQDGLYGVQKDLPKAVALMELATSRGSYISAACLGRLYADGDVGLSKDPERAKKFYALARPLMEKNVAAGDARSKYWLSHFYRDGLAGLPKDPARTLALVTEAAEGGNAGAMSQLARTYLTGTEGVPADEARGMRWLRKAVAAGNPTAMWRLAHLIKDGKTLDKDTYITWIQRSAERSPRFAMYDLAQAYETGEDGLPRDHDKAIATFKLSANAGDDRAMMDLGLAAYRGHGKDRDRAAAAAWFKAAAVLDNTSAMIQLAQMHHIGEGGFEKDDAKSAAYLRQAADLDDPQAMLELAYCYASGRGLPEDPAQARELVKKAAARGNPRAQALLNKYGH